MLILFIFLARKYIVQHSIQNFNNLFFKDRKEGEILRQEGSQMYPDLSELAKQIE